MGSRASDPGSGVRRVEQSGAQLCALHALIADFAVRELFVLRCRSAAEVGSRVREHRLLAEQQEHGEQQVHHSTAGVHSVV